MPGHQDQEDAPGQCKDCLLLAHQVDGHKDGREELVNDEPWHFLSDVRIGAQCRKKPQDAEEEEDLLLVPGNRDRGRPGRHDCFALLLVRRTPCCKECAGTGYPGGDRVVPVGELDHSEDGHEKNGYLVEEEEEDIEEPWAADAAHAVHGCPVSIRFLQPRHEDLGVDPER
jgi:hypothetical protein